MVRFAWLAKRTRAAAKDLGSNVVAKCLYLQCFTKSPSQKHCKYCVFWNRLTTVVRFGRSQKVKHCKYCENGISTQGSPLGLGVAFLKKSVSEKSTSKLLWEYWNRGSFWRHSCMFLENAFFKTCDCCFKTSLRCNKHKAFWRSKGSEGHSESCF